MKNIKKENFNFEIPKTLANSDARKYLCDKKSEKHIKKLTEYVEKLKNKNEKHQIPFFDPNDGGVKSKVLFLLEAPGSKAVKSGFISRNNPDSTAENMFNFLKKARLHRKETLLWNIVPWYVGNKNQNRIRAVNHNDIKNGLNCLYDLINLLENLKVIVLVGRKAQKVNNNLKEKYSKIKIFHSYHPSPSFVNRAKNNKNKIITVFKKVRKYLDRKIS